MQKRCAARDTHTAERLVVAWRTEREQGESYIFYRAHIKPLFPLLSAGKEPIFLLYKSFILTIHTCMEIECNEKKWSKFQKTYLKVRMVSGR